MIDVALAISCTRRTTPFVTKSSRSTKIQHRDLPQLGAWLYFEVQRQPGPGDHRVRHAGSRQRRYRACPRAGGAAERHPVQDQPDPMEPLPGAPYGRSSNSRIDRFSKVLMEYGFTTIVRKPAVTILMPPAASWRAMLLTVPSARCVSGCRVKRLT